MGIKVKKKLSKKENELCHETTCQKDKKKETIKLKKNKKQ